MKQKVLQILYRYRILLVTLGLAGLFGYSLLRLQMISSPQPDDSYVSSQQTANQSDSIRVKESLRTEIDKLVDTPVDVQPDTLGRPDPFNP